MNCLDQTIYSRLEKLEVPETHPKWALAVSRLEFNAHLELKPFYNNMWLPHMRKKGLISKPFGWSNDAADSFEAWIKGPHGSQFLEFWHPSTAAFALFQK